MSRIWHTEFGPRRVRQEPPSVDEAIVAAGGITDDPAEQAELAAALMGVPVETVRVAMIKHRQRKDVQTTVTFTRRAGAQRAVVVERKPSRRLVPGGGGPTYR